MIIFVIVVPATRTMKVIVSMAIMISMAVLTEGRRLCGVRQVGNNVRTCDDIPHDFFGVKVNVCEMKNRQCGFDSRNRCRCLANKRDSTILL